MRGLPALLALLTLLAPPAVAQDAEREEANWYRVELLVFANRDPDAAYAERWPPLPELVYPEGLLSLEEGPTREPADREFQLLRVEDTRPPLFELYRERSVEQLYQDFRRKQLLRQPDIQWEPLVTLDVPRPHVLLPGEQRELNNQRRQIARSSGLEVLFHESWLQPVPGRAESRPVLIETAPRYGDFPQLQGTVRVYSERYLHVATNLWLNTNGEYLGESARDWRMPAPPLPPDTSIPPPQDFVLAPPEDWLGEVFPEAAAPQPIADGFPTDSAPDSLPELVEEDAAPDPLPLASQIPEDESDTLMDSPDAARPDAARPIAARPDAARPIAARPIAARPIAARPDADLADAGPTPYRATEAEIAAFLAQPSVDYEFRHAVLVQQSRRMRSGELHYIDHPMLGVVIKVSRYEFEPFVTDPEAQPGASAGR